GVGRETQRVKRAFHEHDEPGLAGALEVEEPARERAGRIEVADRTPAGIVPGLKVDQVTILKDGNDNPILVAAVITIPQFVSGDGRGRELPAAEVLPGLVAACGMPAGRVFRGKLKGGKCGGSGSRDWNIDR